MTARLSITDSQLDFLVRDKIALFMVLKNPFTAYSVTMSLRMDSPRIQINHLRVQLAVARTLPGMNEGYVGSFSTGETTFWYQVSHRNWNGYPARTILPIDQPLPKVPPFYVDDEVKFWSGGRVEGVTIKWYSEAPKPSKKNYEAWDGPF